MSDELRDEYSENGISDKEIAKRHEAASEIGTGDETTDHIFADGECLAVPKIPDQYKASDVIGKRIQASSSNTGIPIGKIAPKKKLASIWTGLSDTEKYILMMVSEHRHVTQQQLGVLIILQSRIRQRLVKPRAKKMRDEDSTNNETQEKEKPSARIDAMRSYFEWVTQKKYESPLSYAKTFATTTNKGLSKKVQMLVEDGLIAEITPAYYIDDKDISDRYLETPSLFTKHYYLTPLGAKVLICCTSVQRTTSKDRPVGYVPTYKRAAYQSVLHEAECTEVLCSLASCAMYASNPDDGKDYGLFDVCRFYHEKDVEEKDVEYRGKKIDFKSDGKFVLYVGQIGDFLDFYIEYDSGSSTKDKIKHKTEAFVKYTLWKKKQLGDDFRTPILLLVTQKPADLFPQLYGRTRTTYTTAIKQMSHTYFMDYLKEINTMARVLIADCGAIRRNGTLGACWHRVDLVSGIAETKSYDLITASTLDTPITIERPVSISELEEDDESGAEDNVETQKTKK